MRSKLPSLQALFVFEAAARHLSFTKAAGELNVTPVAVSRMVARLEDSIGIKLFERGKSGNTLTDQGIVLLRSVGSGFDQIAGTLDQLSREHAQGKTVTVSVVNGFASQWLLPRYSDFRKQFPSVSLRLEIAATTGVGPLEAADLGLRKHGRGAETSPRYFCPEVIIPICSGRYFDEFGSLSEMNLRRGHSLIHLDPTTFTWADFFRITGLPEPTSIQPVHCSDAGISVQSAMLDQGIVLGWLQAVAAPLNQKKVIPASRYCIATDRHYILEYRSAAPPTHVREVGEWLIGGMREELEATRSLLEGLTIVRT
ncbi:LysR family transcriptional regulator [Caballeronia sp. LZ008]|uniref:LysR family transcriptional regulator n=1 Tax=Caballeronia sp. LZ008 TaxID=3038560 RepID=UPI0028631ECA|nr:LysR family transcriptional regulator [Caballeronia sp. LZ008]MDR5798097.1 LysR family transcriptional regulator [Caballeronia sp. LZ008]